MFELLMDLNVKIEIKEERELYVKLYIRKNNNFTATLYKIKK